MGQLLHGSARMTRSGFPLGRFVDTRNNVCLLRVDREPTSASRSFPPRRRVNQLCSHHENTGTEDAQLRRRP